MKKLLIIVVLCAFINNCFAQESKPIEFTGVVDVDGVSANELKNRCLNWFAVTFNDSKSILVPSSDDQLNARPLILYKPSVLTGSDQIKGSIKYTLQVQFKDNKLRYIFSDFIHEGNQFAKFNRADFGLITTEVEYTRPISGSTKGWKNKVWNDIKAQIDQSILPLVESLKQGMLKENKGDDNW